MRDSDIVISDRALVGALGPDAITACAAFRAGLSRASELEYYDAGGPSQGGAKLRAHSAGGLTHGFVGPARLSRLLAACLRDLAKRELDVSRTGCFVALPSPARTLQGALALASEQPDKHEQLLLAAKDARVPSDHEYAGAILANALADSPWQRFAKHFVPVMAGHASVAHACHLASEQLRRGAIETAVVIAVDSLLDVDTLDWLNLLQRLKTEDRPAGVVPGEACACLLLQSAAVARRQERQALCVLDTIGLGADPHNILVGQPSTGAVLATLIDEAKQQSGAGPEENWFVIDHNGETARATEWGNSLFHLARKHAGYANALTWFPALGFGDTAAASGGVAACIAIAAWERGYAPSRTAFICSAADGPERAVICLERAG